MADVHFTPDQQRAIDTTEKSVLVTAAAGSGKTAVLIQRIIDIILSGKAEVDEMLVVTFTNAAASEMRLKLIRAINKAMASASEEEAKKLRRQLDKMYRTYISTFHSFARRMVQEFFYLTDLDPTFGIVDTTEGALMELEAMDELFDDGFEKDDFIEGCSFQDFLLHYSDERSEDRLKREMIDIYDKLRSMPDYFDWAERKAEELQANEERWADSPAFCRAEESFRKELSYIIREAAETMRILEEANLPNTADKIRPEIDQIAAISKIYEDQSRHPAERAEESLAVLRSLSFGRLSFGKGEKNAWAEVSEEVKEHREAYKNTVKALSTLDPESTFKQQVLEQAETQPYLLYYIHLLRDFERRYQAKKKEKNVLDFGDLEHTAAAILAHPEAAEELRKRFRYIFIDEYQDTNPLQEHLISRIARPNNVFKVGDVKQSIYGFRQSDPRIFLRTKDAYAAPENEDAETIVLSRNFRSSKTTIDYINDVFRAIMPGYTEEEELTLGRTTSSYDKKPETHVLVVPSRAAKSAPPETLTPDEESRTDREAEAEYVASLVKEIIGREFYDSKTDTVRPVQARDIVILLRKKIAGGDYFDALLRHRIEAVLPDSNDYFDTVEVGIAMALLEVIDNMRRDVPLLAVLRSGIFGFTPEELGEIRAWYTEQGEALKASGSTEASAAEGTSSKSRRRQPYWEAFLAYKQDGADEALREKSKKASERILFWRERAQVMPLDEYIWYLLLDSGYYLLAGSMYGGSRRQANLRILADHARVYAQDKIGSIGRFIRYLDILRKKGINREQASTVSEEDDVVRIMSIHKSKGLEFPFVIVAGMGDRRKSDPFTKGIRFDSELGLALSYVNPEKHYWRPTLLQRAIRRKSSEAETEEELRILYVAMTRAREKLYLVGRLSEKTAEKRETNASTYYGMMAEVLNLDTNIEVTKPLGEAGAEEKREDIHDFLREAAAVPDHSLSDLMKEIDRRLSYEYAYRELLTRRAKYSVSELRLAENAENEKAAEKRAAEADREGEEPRTGRWRRMLLPDRVTASERGTAYHRILEYISFNRAVGDRAYVKEQMEDLVAKGAIEEEVFRTLHLKNIDAFLDSRIAARAAEAERKGLLEKEHPFTIRMNVNGEKAAVQGVIDCAFLEDGAWVLVDYKSNRLRLEADGTPKASELERIRETYHLQTDIYAEALVQGTGYPVKEAYLYLMEYGILLDMSKLPKHA